MKSRNNSSTMSSVRSQLAGVNLDDAVASAMERVESTAAEATVVAVDPPTRVESVGIDQSLADDEPHPFLNSRLLVIVRKVVRSRAGLVFLILVSVLLIVSRALGAGTNLVELAQSRGLQFWLLYVLREGSLLACIISAIFGMRRNLKPGGDLDKLKPLRVTKKVARTARRIGIALKVIAALWIVLLAALFIVIVTLPPTGSSVFVVVSSICGGSGSGLDTCSRALSYTGAAVLVIFSLVITFLAAHWFRSLWAAHLVCSAALRRFKHIVREMDPLDADSWDKKVPRLGQALAYEHLPTLNDGWSFVLSTVMLQAAIFIFVNFAFLNFSLEDRLKEGDLTREQTVESFVDNLTANPSTFIQIVVMLGVLLVPARVTKQCSAVTSALARREFELRMAPAGGESDDERTHRHERAEAVHALEMALRGSSKFGFNVLGVRVTPRVWGGVASASFTLAGVLLSSFGSGI